MFASFSPEAGSPPFGFRQPRFDGRAVDARLLVSTGLRRFSLFDPDADPDSDPARSRLG